MTKEIKNYYKFEDLNVANHHPKKTCHTSHNKFRKFLEVVSKNRCILLANEIYWRRQKNSSANKAGSASVSHRIVFNHIRWILTWKSFFGAISKSDTIKRSLFWRHTLNKYFLGVRTRTRERSSRSGWVINRIAIKLRISSIIFIVFLIFLACLLCF